MKLSKCALLAFVLLTLGRAIPAYAQGEDDLKVARIRQDSPWLGLPVF